MAQVALVTGANRGLGLEVSKQLAELGYTVILTARDAEKGNEAAKSIASSGDVHAVQMDVTDNDSILTARDWVQEKFGQLDVLVNNAAILYDTWQRASTADLQQVQQAFDTNTLGAWRIAQAFMPMLRKSEHGRLVNVSSEAGSLASMGSGTPAYNISKVALNALTIMLAQELRSDGVLVNAICPGWTATDMGGGGRPIPEGAKSIVWAVTLPDDGETGGFFRDGKQLNW